MDSAHRAVPAPALGTAGNPLCIVCGPEIEETETTVYFLCDKCAKVPRERKKPN